MKSNIKKAVYLLCKISLIFISLQNYLYAQKIQIPYINYTSENGLPSDQVYQCIQDREGYMWFATDNGISRFDGYTFKNYGPKEGLNQPVIFNIQEDKFGRILFSGVNREFFMLDKKHDRIVKIESVTNCFRNEEAYKLDFYFDNHTEQLIVKAYAYYKFYLFDKNFKFIGEKKADVPTVYTNGNFMTTYGRQFRNDKMQIANIVNSKFEVIKKFTLPQFFNNFFLFNKSNDLILITDTKRNIIFDKQLNVHYIKKKVYNWIYSGNGYLAGLSNSGGLVFSSTLKQLVNQQYKLLIPNIEISHIYCDRNQNIWCCTLNNGVYLIQSIDNLQFNVNTDEIFKSIFVNGSEEILLLSKSGKIFKTNLINFSKLNVEAKVTKITKYKNHYLLIKNNSLFGYDGSHIRQFLMKSGASDFAVTFLVFDPKNENRIFCTSGGNLIYFNLLKSKIVWFVPHFRAIDLLFTDTGQLLISNINGLGYLKNKKVQLYDSLGSFPNQRIDFIRKLSNGIIVLGSKTNGIFINEKNKYFNITTNNGLASNKVNCIKVDTKDNIWIGTDNGMEKMCYLGDGKFTLEHISESQGMQSNIVYDIDYDEKKERIYATTIGGLFVYDCSKALTTIRQKYPDIIETVLVNNKVMQIKDGKELPYDSNNLSIKLLSFQYKMNGKISYQFKLNKGPWEDLGTNRTVNLLALNPGKYQFHYKSKNENGEWNPINIFHFTILKPWYQNSIFYMVVIAGLTLGFYIFYRRRITTINKENELKEEIVYLERVALQAQMNPHFIFNSLNSIQNYILNNDKIQASEYLSKFAALVRINLYYSNKSKISLSDEINMLNNYLQLEKMRFKDKFIYQINFKNKNSRPSNEIFISPMLIQPIIENSIKHGIGDAKEFSIITLTFEESDGVLMVTVEDDGPGLIEKKVSPDKFSMGTSITSQRLNLLSQDLGDGFVLRNRYNENKEIIGAEAILRIRILKHDSIV